MKLLRFKASFPTGNHPDNPENLMRDENGPFVKFDDYMELHRLAEALLEWVDMVPLEIILSGTPKVDRDWVDEVLEKSKNKSI